MSAVVRRLIHGLAAGVSAAFLAAGPVRGAEPPSINVQQQGTHLLVSGEVSVAASPETAWSVLTDYQRVPEFVPGIRISRVIEAGADGKLIEQQGEMLANNMRMFYQGTLRVVEQPPRRIEVQFLSGTFANMRGQWVITGKRAPVRLGYGLDYDTMTPYPSPVMVAMIQQQVALWVGSLAAEMERREPPHREPEKTRKKRRKPS